MRLALALAATLAATSADALSCMAPDIANAYAFASGSENRYIAVLGTVIFDSEALDRPRGGAQPQDKATAGRFSGESFRLDGSRQPYEADVTVVSECWASWCGNPLSGRTCVGFLRLDRTGPVMVSDPCGNQIFYDPSPKDIARLSQCLAGGPCEPAM